MKKALVVEDNPDILNILVYEMELIGFSVITANNGRDGVEKALEEKPDMILMDIMMPFMNGIDVVRMIRSNPETHSVPILVVTAMTNYIALKRCIEAGCNDYLIKPFTFKNLQNKIQDLIPSVFDTDQRSACNKRLSLFSNQAAFPDRYFKAVDRNAHLEANDGSSARCGSPLPGLHLKTEP